MEELKQFMDYLTSWQIPSADCCIYQGGKEVFRYYCGYMDSENRIAINRNQIYRVYSISKIFTCTMAMILWEKGKISLEDKLDYYFPEYREIYVKAGKKRIKTDKHITIENLLTMTAGFNYDLECPSIKMLVEKDDEFTTQDLIRALATEPLDFEPGERWQYSLCYDVIGGVIEKVTDMKLGEAMDKWIFAPLGLSKTGFDVSQENSYLYAKQYKFDEKDQKYLYAGENNQYEPSKKQESGGAGLFSTVDEMMVFERALCDNRLIKEETRRLMTENHLNKRQADFYNWPSLEGYGYGFGVRTLVDKSYGSRSSIGEFGWSGAAGGYALVDPVRNIQIFYAQQMLNNQEAYIHPKIRNLAYKELDKREYACGTLTHY